MDCQRCQVMLPQYSAGELNPEDAQRLEDHLTECARCRAHRAAEPYLEALLTAIPVYEPPPEFTETVLARIRPQAQHAPDMTRHWISFVAAALSTMVLVVAMQRLIHSLHAATQVAGGNGAGVDLWRISLKLPMPELAHPGMPAMAVVALTIVSLWVAWAALERA